MFEKIIDISENDDVYIMNSDEVHGCGYVNDREKLYYINLSQKKAYLLPEKYHNTPIYIYPHCGGYYEGLIMVSLMGELELQYFDRLHAAAGMWGWLDTEGNEVIAPQYAYAFHFENGHAIVGKGTWEINEEGLYVCFDLLWGMIDKTGREVVPCKFTEIFNIDNTTSYVLCEKYKDEEFQLCVYNIDSGCEVVELDFEFDNGYMMNSCYWDNNCIVFDEHIPGEERNYSTVYSLTDNKWLKVHELVEGCTLNGETKIVVDKDGEEIIFF